ncbi:MAG: hypothetical protein IJH38_07745, partial [Clostridia bacterium]|nr:hypothetical protein [Clostridia bacterium]
KATVTLKGMGKYTGTVKAKFRILPRRPEILKVTADKRLVTVEWKPRKGISGYELEFSRKKSFPKDEVVVVDITDPAQRELTLENNGVWGTKKFYVRIRSYRQIKKVRYYSRWSEVKTGKTKK